MLDENETDKDASLRDHIMLTEANQNAIIYAYTKQANEINIRKSNIYVIYIYDEADTDLKVGDEIISINNININKKEDITNILNNSNKDDTLSILVKNNGNEFERYAK